jgi:hypothetical protein
VVIKDSVSIPEKSLYELVVVGDESMFADASISLVDDKVTFAIVLVLSPLDVR